MSDLVKELASVELAEVDKNEVMALEPEKTYYGSFVIKKSGLIKVKPYKQGTKPSNLHKIVDGDGYAIFASKRLLRVVVTLPKGEREDVKNTFKDAMLECFKDLSEINYE